MARNIEIQLLSWAALGDAAECFKTLAHPVRLRMIQLMLHDRYTVGELAKECDIPSHMASEHLRLMQRVGFLSSEKDGRRAFYQVSEVHLVNLMDCIKSRFGDVEDGVGGGGNGVGGSGVGGS